MNSIRRTTATIGATVLLATSLAAVATVPAHAADREFRHAGAEVDYDVERDDNRYEIEVDVDDAQPGSRWRIVLRHNGKVFHKKVHRADGDGEIEVDRERANTRGRDTFKLTIKKIGGPAARTSTIRRR